MTGVVCTRCQRRWCPSEEAAFCLILTRMEKIDPKKLDKAIALYEGGFSYRQAADISGISKSAIQREAEKRGVSRSKGERAEASSPRQS